MAREPLFHETLIRLIRLILIPGIAGAVVAVGLVSFIPKMIMQLGRDVPFSAAVDSSLYHTLMPYQQLLDGYHVEPSVWVFPLVGFVIFAFFSFMYYSDDL